MPVKKRAAEEQVSIRVELFGSARSACGNRLLDVSVPPHARVADLALALVDACPELRGVAVRDDLGGLRQSYTFNLNGMEFLTDEAVRLAQGDTLLLFSSQAGG